MISAYDFKELAEKALATQTEEDINALGEWFENYGDKYWNGECYAIDSRYNLFPVYKQTDEDEFEVVGWEIR